MSELPSSVCQPKQTTVGELLEAARNGSLASQLEQLGLEASRSSDFEAAARHLIASEVSTSTRAFAFWVPGRIEVAGKHTDYAGGRSLLCAVNRGFAVVSAERSDAVCRIFASFEEKDEVQVAEMSLHSESRDESLPGWALYPESAVLRLARNFSIHGGINAAFSCDLPAASGMSSSSAIITLTFLCLAARNKLATLPKFVSELGTAELLTHYLGCIENGQVRRS